MRVIKITANADEDAMYIYTDDGYIIPFAYFMGRLEDESEQDYINMLVTTVESGSDYGFIRYPAEEFFSPLFYNTEEGFEIIYQITLH